MRQPAPTPAQFLVRHRIKRRLLIASALLAIAGATWFDHQHQRDDIRRYEGKTFEVAYVIDGDTLDLQTPDPPRATTRIRLWGIDAPEIAHPQYHDKPAEPFGPEATRLTRELCDGKNVTIHLQPHRLRDRSDMRLLAYLTLPDGTSLNERLIAAGLARADDRWDHECFERYAHLERQAKQDRAGMWTSNAPSKRSAAATQTSRSISNK